MKIVTTICLLLLLLLLVLAPAARADQIEVTAQAKAARAEFLLRVPPPATPATICLVDTGVNANPDTVGVFARLSLPMLNGSDQSPTLHGTQTAMFMGAQSNGFGMVGLWPHARIVSVQSNFPGQDVFPIGGYIAGIHRCDTEAQLYGIKVIVVALSTETPLTGADLVDMADAVATARHHGMNVVVAGGNNDGRPVGTPANVPGAFSIGAVDAGTGSLCPTSATGALLLAPGCGVDGADPQTGAPGQSQNGTSAAAAIAAAAMAAFRTWRPDLAPDVVEQVLNETAVATADGRRLDLTAAFVAAGLHTVVEPPAPPPAPAPAPATKARLVKPRLTVREKGRGSRRTLTIRGSNRARGTTLTVRVYRGSGKSLRRLTTKTRPSSKIVLRVSRRWTRVTGHYKDPTGAKLPSPSAVVSRRR